MNYSVDLALWKKVVSIDEYFTIEVEVDTEKYAKISIHSRDNSKISKSDKMFFFGVQCTINQLTNHKWVCVQDPEEDTTVLTFIETQA